MEENEIVIDKTEDMIPADSEETSESVSVVDEIIALINSDLPAQELKKRLTDYHENDIADAITMVDVDTRKNLYDLLGVETVSEIFTYLEDVSDYLEEITPEQAADVLENMDADDAVDALEDIENEEVREQLISLMEEEASEDVRLINSYEDDEIGSMMTTNFIVVNDNQSIKQTMRSVVKQAQDNDNVSTIYVQDDEGKYCGAIDLRDLIVAREYTPLEDIISRSYPSVDGREKISDTIEMLRDYAEDSIPVLNEDDEIIGVITSQDIIEAVDDEMGDDYAKLAGLTAEEDLEEKLRDSIRKRMPWLVLLLLLGMMVSTVVGVFENIVASMAIVMCFQSLILDMAGNVGTQSLAVTIRVLMDENVSGKEKLVFVFKEMRVGATNGLILGSLAFAFVGMYLHYFKNYAWIGALHTNPGAFQISGCVGLALLLAMIISSFMGTIIPMFFHKIKVDPAVASGPLITTVNDLVAVIAYYGLAGLLLVGIN